MPRWRCWTHDYQSLSIGHYLLLSGYDMAVICTSILYPTISINTPGTGTGTNTGTEYSVQYPGTYRPVIGTFSERKISGSPDPLSGRGNNTVNTWHRTDPAVDQPVTRAGRYHLLPYRRHLIQPRKCFSHTHPHSHPHRHQKDT